MKMTDQIRNEMDFLGSFYSLLKTKVNLNCETPASLMNVFKVEASKLHDQGQVLQASIDAFVEGMSLDAQLEKADKDLKEAKANRAAIIKKKQTFTIHGSDKVKISTDPCSRPITRSHC